MEFLSEFGLFFIKVIVLVIAAFFVIGSFMNARMREKSQPGILEVRYINDRLELYAKGLLSHKVTGTQKKALEKKLKKQARKHKNKERNRLFVLSFKGDVFAKASANLREEITAILEVANSNDEVLVQLESPGGAPHSYGFASSQLHRLRNSKIPLTIAVDKVAASGGYMMACVADKIIAAPFAILGSIGAIGQMPNVHKLLKKMDVDFEVHTAGKHKRNLTIFGENTDQNREKFKEDLQDLHTLFKQHVTSFRPQIDIEKIANGDTWFGSQAIDNKLIDEIMTSDEYIQQRTEDWAIFEISYMRRKSFQNRLSKGVEKGLLSFVTEGLAKLRESRFF